MKKIIRQGTWIGILLLVGCCAMHEGADWEYKRVVNAPDTVLNELAKKGWVVVSFAQVPIGTESQTTYLLKRLSRRTN
jgi:hypothetical protein